MHACGMAPAATISARPPSSNDRLCSRRSESPVSSPSMLPLPASACQGSMPGDARAACGARRPPSDAPPADPSTDAASAPCSNPGPDHTAPSRPTARGTTRAVSAAAAPGGVAARRSSAAAAVAARRGSALSSSRPSVCTAACAQQGCAWPMLSRTVGAMSEWCGGKMTHMADAAPLCVHFKCSLLLAPCRQHQSHALAQAARQQLLTCCIASPAASRGVLAASRFPSSAAASACRRSLARPTPSAPSSAPASDARRRGFADAARAACCGDGAVSSCAAGMVLSSPSLVIDMFLWAACSHLLFAPSVLCTSACHAAHTVAWILRPPVTLITAHI